MALSNNRDDDKFDEEYPEEFDNDTSNGNYHGPVFHGVPMGAAMFIQGKPGKNFNPTDFINSMLTSSGNLRAIEEFRLMGGQWVLRIVDRIESEESGFGTFYMELYPDLSITGGKTPNIDALEMYELVTKTQFINFVLANLGEYVVYDMDSIKCIVHEDQERKFVGLKIIAQRIRRKVPTWMQSCGPNFQISSTTVLEDIAGIPILRHQQKSRHMCAPLVIYDLTATIASNSPKTFDSSELDIGNTYVKLIAPILRDAIMEFHAGSNGAAEYVMNNTSKLHTVFHVDVERNMLTARVICSPGIIGGDLGAHIYRYDYVGDMTHMISISPIAKTPEPSEVDLNIVIDRCMSQFVHSDMTQLFVESLDYLGNKFTENRLNFMQKINPLFFSCDMNFDTGEEWLNGKPINCSIMMTEKYPDLIRGYWIPRNGPIEMSFDDGRYMIYGLININPGASASYKIEDNVALVEFLLKNDSLAKRFRIPDLPKTGIFKSVQTGGLVLCLCSVDEHNARLLLLRELKDKKERD